MIILLLDLPQEDIILEKESKNTYQNAECIAKILKEKKYNQLILVTSRFHLKRSLLYLSNFNLSPQPQLGDYLSVYPSYKFMGYHFALADLALKEYCNSPGTSS